MPILDRDGRKVSYEDYGAGPVALLIHGSPGNAKSWRERYTPESFRRLSMPVVTIVGRRSPEMTHRIAQVIAAYAPSGSLLQIEKATHALTTTHVDAVARTLAEIAAQAAQPGPSISPKGAAK